MRLLRTLSVVLLLAGCASGSGQAQTDQPTHETTNSEWPVSAHYDGKRFYNTSGADKGAGDISTFLWQNLWNKEKWPKQVENPPADPIVERVTEGIRATYINHATVLVQVAGLNILTDPVWSKRVSPVTFAGPKRVRDPGIPIEALPEIDLILVSHNHYDHLDTASLKKLRQQQDKEPVIVSGLGNAKLLRKQGYANALEFDWGQHTQVGPATVHFVECQHRSGRGVADQMKTLWGSFVVETPDGATQVGDRKMKKIIFAMAMSVGFAAAASAQTTWQMNNNGSSFGWDNRGKTFQSQTDRMGNTYGYDNRGNPYYSHQDRSGNINGWDSRGNSYQGYSDRPGNTYMYDNRGNSRTCQQVGNQTFCF